MNRVIVTAATTAMLFGAAASITPAEAEMHYGPTRNGNQCYINSRGWTTEGFGYWGSCPGQATQQANRPSGSAQSTPDIDNIPRTSRAQSRPKQQQAH
jgi:hypothetical protein